MIRFLQYEAPQVTILNLDCDIIKTSGSIIDPAKDNCVDDDFDISNKL